MMKVTKLCVAAPSLLPPNLPLNDAMLANTTKEKPKTRTPMGMIATAQSIPEFWLGLTLQGKAFFVLSPQMKENAIVMIPAQQVPRPHQKTLVQQKWMKKKLRGRKKSF